MSASPKTILRGDCLFILIPSIVSYNLLYLFLQVVDSKRDVKQQPDDNEKIVAFHLAIVSIIRRDVTVILLLENQDDVTVCWPILEVRPCHE
jgi:hypothetical protein